MNVEAVHLPRPPPVRDELSSSDPGVTDVVTADVWMASPRGGRLFGVTSAQPAEERLISFSSRGACMLHLLHFQFMLPRVY